MTLARIDTQSLPPNLKTTAVGRRTFRWLQVIMLLAAACCGATASAATLPAGLKLTGSYTQDYFRDVAGGAHRGGGAPGRIDLSANVDGRAWGGSLDDVFHVHLLGTLGSSISRQAGDLQGLDNDEAYNTFKVFAAWYQHSFGHSGLSLRLGLQDYNALFDVLDAAGVFINSSFGLEPTVSQLPVSTFPITTVGAALRWRSPAGPYLLAGIYDGTPGLPGHPAGTHVAFGPGNGVFTALEAGINGGAQDPYKLAIGGWYRTSVYRDPSGQPHNRNHGLYVIGQRRLYGGGAKPTVVGFVQLGSAQSDRNTVKRYIGAGVNVTGLVAHRPHDVLGLGVARAYVSNRYRGGMASGSNAETAVELTYQAPLSHGLTVQPDLQYIINPGAKGNVDNAWVVGVRAQLAW